MLGLDKHGGHAEDEDDDASQWITLKAAGLDVDDAIGVARPKKNKKKRSSFGSMKSGNTRYVNDMEMQNLAGTIASGQSDATDGSRGGLPTPGMEHAADLRSLPFKL